MYINYNCYYGKTIKINNNYFLQFRKNKNLSVYPEESNENVIFFKIDKLFNIKQLNINIDFENANHNIQFFNINNKLFAIGGQHLGSLRLRHPFYTDNKYRSFLKNKNNIISWKENPSFFQDNYINKRNKWIINPYVHCNFYANGLYLFEFNLNELNYKNIKNYVATKIITGIENNRHDGYYGTHPDKTKFGLSVFDSTNSIIYNKNKYILFCRANLERCIRYIQYSTSEDLKKWDGFKLLKLNPQPDLNNINIYQPNFFKLENIKGFFGVLCISESQDKINDVNINKNIPISVNLYYSIDGEEWFLKKNITNIFYHKQWVISGELILKDNDYLLLIHDNELKKINIIKIDKSLLENISKNHKN